MSEADIETSIAEDPEWKAFADIDWSKIGISSILAKQPISIRLDPDVLAYFKAGGPRYQSRINAVLKAYVRAAEKRKAKAGEKA